MFETTKSTAVWEIGHSL